MLSDEVKKVIISIGEYAYNLLTNADIKTERIHTLVAAKEFAMLKDESFLQTFLDGDNVKAGIIFMCPIRYICADYFPKMNIKNSEIMAFLTWYVEAFIDIMLKISFEDFCKIKNTLVLEGVNLKVKRYNTTIDYNQFFNMTYTTEKEMTEKFVFLKNNMLNFYKLKATIPYLEQKEFLKFKYFRPFKYQKFIRSHSL